MYCRLAKAAVVDVDDDAAGDDAVDGELVVELVDVGTGEGVTGGCCATLMFEMLRLKGAKGPVYVQWIRLIPHVNISPACGKTMDAEELAVAAVVEGVVDMMNKRRWEGAPGGTAAKQQDN